MANIIKKDGGQAAEASPVRAMRDLLQWDPFREMAPLFGWDPFREMARIVPSFNVAQWNPHFDVTENKDAYVFKADLPGVKKEDIEITTTGNRLQVAGKREIEEETKNDTVYTYERQYGTFMRAFTLPDGVDLEHAKSELKEGVLTLVIPKTALAQAKKIPIGTAEKKS